MFPEHRDAEPINRCDRLECDARVPNIGRVNGRVLGSMDAVLELSIAIEEFNSDGDELPVYEEVARERERERERMKLPPAYDELCADEVHDTCSLEYSW